MVVEAGRDAEQVANRGRILVRREELPEAAVVEAMVAREPGRGRAFRAGRDLAVEFGAVAGREDRALRDARLARQVVQCGYDAVGVERDP